MDIVAELKARAQSAFLEKSYEACISITSEAIGRLSQLASLSGGPEPRAELSRELSRLHSNRAAARLELGDFIAAADDAQQAVAFDGSWHRPYMRLCLALSFLNRRDDAAEALQRGLLACSGNADQLIDLQAALKDLQMQQRVVRRRQDAPEREGGRRAGERQHNRNLPVIALCGFLGAGKTTLVRHLLSSLQAQAEGPALPQHHQQHLGDLPQVPPPRGQMAAFAPQEMHAGQAASCTFHGPRQLRIGLIVNDLAPLNVDAQLLALPLQHPQPVTHPQPPAGTAAAAGRPAEADPSVGTAGVPAAAPSPHLGDPAAGAAATLVELSNGCVCCNLKGDLQQALRSMADFRAGGGHGGKGGEGSSIEVRGAGAAGAGDGTCMGQADGTSADGKGAVDGGSGSGSRRGARGGGSGGQNAAAGGISSSSRGTHGSDSGRKEGMLDLVVVESTGVGEPEALAAAVAALEPYGVVLHSVVTVVDAGSFLSYMLPYGTEQPAGNGSGGGGAGLADGRAGWMGSGGAAGTGGGVEGGVGGDGRKPLASLLAQQVECADVVLVNKCDLLLQQCVEEEHQREQEAAVALGAAKEEGMGTDPQARVGEGRSGGSRSATGSAAAAAEREARRRLGRVVAAVRALNRTARVVTCCECRVGPEVVLCGVGEGLGEGGGAAGAGPRVRRIAGATEQAGGTVDDGSDGMVLEQGGVFRGAQLPGPLAAGKGAAWGSAGGEDRAHEEEEYGIGSVVFKDRRPFHPGRLWAMVQALVEQQGERGREEGQAPSGRVQRTAEGSTAGAASGGGGPSTEGAGPLPAVPAQLLPMPRLLRAKGLFWVASLPQVRLERRCHKDSSRVLCCLRYSIPYSSAG